MAFFKKVLKKMGGKWHPQAVTVGKPVTTKEVADRLSQISTVSRADVFAVLMDLAGVLADYMAQGRSVKIDGLGTFYYTCTSNGNGADTADKVNASQITGVRVRFIPEATKKSGSKSMNRTLVSETIFWMEWNGKVDETPVDGGGSSSGGDGGSGGDDRPVIE